MTGGARNDKRGPGTAMEHRIEKIGCIVMASGLSERYGKNKLLEKLDGREVILHAAGNLAEAGFRPLAVTRSPEVRALLDREGIACVLHEGARKSDTMHVGILGLDPDAAGWLFMPGDQPLVRPATLRRLAEQFFRSPERAVRLGSGGTPGSPVLFPAGCREALLAYTGDRGGAAVLKEKQIPCDLVEAEDPRELWDADTTESMERIRAAYGELREKGRLQTAGPVRSG